MRKLFALFALAILVSQVRQAHADTLTVAELFTSQSCSSCPPADALLGEMAKRPDFIALGCHVTYWNHLNWRDTLSQEFCTARQNAYDKTLGAGVFTPQLVINGTTSMVGSNRLSVEAQLLLKGQNPYALTVTHDGDNIKIAIPAVDNVGNADLLLVRYGDPVTLPIGAGENGGRTLTYTNPVLGIDKIGQWQPGQTVTAPLPKLPGHFVVLAQATGADRTGQIVAAGRLDKP